MMGMEMGMSLVITVVTLVFTLGITAVSVYFAFRMLRGFTQSMQQSQQLLATGQPAQARILAVRDLGGSISIGGQLPQQRLQIDLQVTPMNGQTYNVSVTQLVSMLHMGRLTPGNVVEVRYDAMNPMNVAVVL